MDPDSTKQERLRKRARVACSWCHDRKVRCDVAIQGLPCTNCKLDRHECRTRTTKTTPKTRSTNLNIRRTQARPLPSRSISHDGGMNQSHLVRTISYGISSLEPVDDMSNMTPFLSMNSSAGFTYDINHLIPLPFVQTVPNNPGPSANVPFATYQFLKLTRLDQLPFEDVSFLELKGCFCVPESRYLDIFITKYFLYVHPCLPVINEAEVWRMYRPKGSDNVSGQQISLFVLQAMLFASSVFVPGHILNAVGFYDIRAARTAFYQRAKLLFDFDTEIDVLPRAQGALLLTFQTTALDFFSGTRWLSVAMQLARSIEADLFSHDLRRSPDTVSKKRLWWCIILRDRIHSLALRRPTQVGLERGGIPTKYLDEEDLADEIQNSRVYDPKEKTQLVAIFRLQCDLAIVITELVNITYAPLWGTVRKSDSQETFYTIQNEVDRMKVGLQRWRDTADKLLETQSTSLGIAVFNKLTRIYYDSARLAVSHYEGLMWETKYANLYPSKMQFIKKDIEEVIMSMAGIVKELITHGLASHLPISVVAHVALPLLLSTLDSGFSSTRLQRAGRRRQLHFYQEVMRVLGSRYEAADKVCAFIDSALSFSGTKLGIYFTPGGNELLRNDEYPEDLDDTDEGNPPNQLRSVAGSRFKNVCEYFARQPRSYLWLSLTLDYALYRGQYPLQSDIERLWGELQLAEPRQPSDVQVQQMTEDATSSSSIVQQMPGEISLDLLDTQNLYSEKDIGFDDFGDGLGTSDMEYLTNGFISPPSMIMMNTPLQ